MDKYDKIYVAGHKGMVGSAILRKLKKEGYHNIITRRHSELDLTDQNSVKEFFETQSPDYVFLCAAKVGGIMANSSNKAEFFYINSMIAQNVIHQSYRSGVKKLMNLGSSCIYPKMAPQPLKEEYLLTGPLEETNDAYAIAKISAIKMCHYYNTQYGTNFLSVMPTNLYGKNDNYDLQTSHVFPAMIRKFHEGKINSDDVLLWGDGSPLREFLISDDLADAVYYLMQNCSSAEVGEFVNIGTGKDCTLKELAEKIAAAVGFKGKITWDPSKPNGTPRKLLDVSKINQLGWKSNITLDSGIKQTYEEYKKSLE